MISVLFVCTGNTCRSAMAEHYAEYKLKELSRENDIYVDSAGINAYGNDRAMNNAINALSRYVTNIKNHRAKNIDDMDIKGFDYIFTMTSFQKIDLIQIFPEIKDKIYILKEFVFDDSETNDISDPWGCTQKVYDDTFNEIKICIDKLFDKI